MIIASIYPSPFDTERDMRATSIVKDGQIYSYEEAKLTSVKLDLQQNILKDHCFLGVNN